MNLKKLYNEKRELLKLKNTVQMTDKAVAVTIADENSSFTIVKDIKAGKAAMAYSDAFEEAVKFFLDIEEKETKEEENGLIDQIMPMPDPATIVENIPEKEVIPAIPVTPIAERPIATSETQPTDATIPAQISAVSDAENLSIPETKAETEIQAAHEPAPTPEMFIMGMPPVTMSSVPDVSEAIPSMIPTPPVMQMPAYAQMSAPAGVSTQTVTTFDTVNGYESGVDMIIAEQMQNLANIESEVSMQIPYESINPVQQAINEQLANAQIDTTIDENDVEIPFGPALGLKISEMGITNAEWYVKNIPDHSKYLQYREQIRTYYQIQ